MRKPSSEIFEIFKKSEIFLSKVIIIHFNVQ